MKVYLLLLKHPSGESVFRAVATIFAVIIATLIILVAVSLGQGWIARDQKTNLAVNLLSTGTHDSAEGIENPVYLSTYDSKFNSTSIKEVGIRKTDRADILPAGLTNTPEDNELWVTPKLKRLIDTNPLLAERYIRYDVKVLFPPELAPSPDSLMLLYRIQEGAINTGNRELRVSSAAQLRGNFNRQKEQDSEYTALRVTISLLAGAIIITPVLLLVAEIARIGMAQREKRYATLSLIGVTNQQIGVLTALEMLPLSFLGSILGIAIFILVGLPVIANMSIGGNVIWFDDLNLSFVIYLVICVAVILSTAIAGLQSISKVKISPLAVTRTHNDIKKPSLFSALLLLLGTAGLLALSTFGKSWYKDNMDFGGYVIAGLSIAIILGIFIAGPYLTYKLASILIRYSHGASTTLAAYRLRFVYRKEFRSISGIILALFVGALLMALLATIQTIGTKYQNAQAAALESFNPLQSPLQVTVYLPETNTNKLLEAFKGDTEFRGLTSNFFVQKSFSENSNTEDVSDSQRVGNYYESCLLFKQRTGHSCDSDIDPNKPFIVTMQFASVPGTTFSKIVPKFVPVNPTQGKISDSSYVLIAKDHQSLDSVVNRSYNIVSDYYRKTGTAVLVEYNSTNNAGPIEVIKNLEGLIMIMLIIAMTTGGLSLIVNVTGSIFERKRTFVRLRIAGASITALAKSLSIEVFVPLCVLSLLVVSLGILTCYCLLSTLGVFNDGRVDFSMPSVTLWIGFGVAIIFSVIVSLLTIPLLAKLTNFDEMRSE
jgi:hypothetical protein